MFYVVGAVVKHGMVSPKRKKVPKVVQNMVVELENGFVLRLGGRGCASSSRRYGYDDAVFLDQRFNVPIGILGWQTVWSFGARCREAL
jgi:hypothetical protein